MTNSLLDIQPMTEAEFWQTLGATSFQQPPIQEPKPSCSNNEAIEEDLADIHQFIANDIGSTELFLPNSASSTAGKLDPLLQGPKFVLGNNFCLMVFNWF